MVEREMPFSSDGSFKDAVFEAMGYGEAARDEAVSTIVDDLMGRILPRTRIRYAYEIVEASCPARGEVLLGGVRFAPGGIICSYLKGMTHACVFIATAGEEEAAVVREIRAEGDIVADFVADSIGSVLAESAVDALEREIYGKMGLSLPYSPGYCGWDVREQKALFSLFPEGTCGVRLSESCLMSPEKSVSGFFALGDTLVRQPYHCDICQNSKCYKRKAKAKR